jgi:hypothetical protein
VSLISVTESFATADEALLDCTRRFKSLPDRHFVFSRMLKKSASGVLASLSGTVKREA